jgi:hypothetical protein
MDETLTWGDTLVFPIFGSIALLGLWGLLKYAGAEWINFLLGIYCALQLCELFGVTLIGFEVSGAGMFAFHSVCQIQPSQCPS